MTLRVLRCPPLFFAERREWASVVLNGVLYGFCLVAVVAAGLRGLIARDGGAGWLLLIPAFLLWLLCLAHAADARRREKAAARAGAQLSLRRPTWAKLVKLAVFLLSLGAIMVLLKSLFDNEILGRINELAREEHELFVAHRLNRAPCGAHLKGRSIAAAVVFVAHRSSTESSKPIPASSGY